MLAFRRLAALTAALGALLAAVGAGAQPAPTIEPGRLREHVRVLSSDAFAGRGPGEVGEIRTLDYMVAQFTAAGLQPGGENGTWFQTIALTRLDRTATSLSIRVAGRALPLVQARDWSVASNLPGRQAAAAAPLVFMGYGVHAPELGWRGYEGVDLTGKVAVFLVNDPDFDQPGGSFGGRARSPYAAAGAKAREAYARGAVGVLFIHEPVAASWSWRQIENADPDPDFVLGALPAPSGRPDLLMWIRGEPATALFRAAGLDLAALSERARRPEFRGVPIGDATLTAETTVTASPFSTRNVVARLDGGARAAETVIYGAHWDAYGLGPDVGGDRIRNGAIDNGIGTAELLEIARAFAAGPRPARTVLFIGYTSEEDGLLGAYGYVAGPLRPLETTAAVFNLDPHLALPRTRSIELIGAGRTDLEDDLARVAAAQGLAMEAEASPEAGWYTRSDHYAFAQAGVPAVYFRAGRDLVEGGTAAGSAQVAAYNFEHYHQRSDAFDPSWTLEAAAQEASVALALGREIADGGRWPGWRAGVEFQAARDATASARR